MASNLDYLAPALEPLEEKVKAYLNAEKNLRQAHEAIINEPRQAAEQAQAATEFEQRPPTGSFDQADDELRQAQQMQHEDLDRLRQEIIALLPTRDEWVKVNLGYGPSRVGAWQVPGAAEHYELRIVH